jgi:DNA-binding transcriptional ArsR family regulator
LDGVGGREAEAQGDSAEGAGGAGEAGVGAGVLGTEAGGAGVDVGEAGAGADEVFTALADPTRRRLLDQLSTQGPLSATDLASGYSVSRQAVVKHLGALSAAGLLRSERHGRQVLYGVVPERLHQATAWLADVGDRWDSRLAALSEQLRRDRS